MSEPLDVPLPERVRVTMSEPLPDYGDDKHVALEIQLGPIDEVLILEGDRSLAFQVQNTPPYGRIQHETFFELDLKEVSKLRDICNRVLEMP